MCWLHIQPVTFAISRVIWTGQVFSEPGTLAAVLTEATRGMWCPVGACAATGRGLSEPRGKQNAFHWWCFSWEIKQWYWHGKISILISNINKCLFTLVRSRISKRSWWKRWPHMYKCMDDCIQTVTYRSSQLIHFLSGRRSFGCLVKKIWFRIRSEEM